MFIEFERGLGDAKRWFRHSDLSLRNWFGRTVAMAPAQPVNPRTSDQTAARGSMKEAGQAWRELPDFARQSWTAYARRFGTSIGEQRYKDLSGWDVFLPARRNQALLEQEPAQLPVDAAPPTAVTTIEEVPATEDRTFTFRLTHGVVPDGHVLLVRITPQMPTRGRKPNSHLARMIRGHDQQSTVALPANGGTVTFTEAQFAIAKGERYGVAMRIIRTADGVHSREFFADLYREGAQPQNLPETPEPVALDHPPIISAGDSLARGENNAVPMSDADPGVPPYSSSGSSTPSPGSSGTYSRRSPGVQFRALHKALSVEKRIARALFVFRIDRLLTARPVSSASSMSFMRLSSSR